MARSEIQNGTSGRRERAGLRSGSDARDDAPEGREISAAAGDAELIEAVATGDGEALAVLYDRHGAAVYALCLRILRSAEEAEEVLEDVFWQLWQHADRYRTSRGTALAYLLTLGRSRAIDRLRTRTRRARLGGELSEGAAESREPFHSPLHETLTRERQARLLRALETLPEVQRQAVELSFLEGLSHPEISSRLGEPLGTIKTRIRNGLLRLRSTLADPTEGTGA